MSLDQEMELRLLLESSPEARALLREMTLLRRAARRLPTMDAPRRNVESRLFRQLQAEGLHAGAPRPAAPTDRPVAADPSAPPAAAPMEAPGADRAPAPRRRLPVMRGAVTTFALLLLFLIISDPLITPERDSTLSPIAAVVPHSGTDVTTLADAPAGTELSSGMTSRDEASPVRGFRSEGASRARATHNSEHRVAGSAIGSTAGSVGYHAAAVGTAGGSLDDVASEPALAAKLAPQESRPSDDVRPRMMAFGGRARGPEAPAARMDDAGSRDAGSQGVMAQSLTAQGIATQGAPALPPEAMTLRRAIGGSRLGASAPVPDEDRTVRPRYVGRGGDPSFAASLRPGVSYIGKGGGMMAQEMSLRFDASLGRHHQLSLIAGRAPTVSETRTDRTRLPDEPQALSSMMRSADSKNTNFEDPTPAPATENASTPAPAPATPATTSSTALALRNEVWVGLGYTYTFAPVEGMNIGAGAKAGGSPTSWRVGVELPIRYRITPAVSVEAVPSASFVAPYDGSSSAYAADASGDGFSYKGEQQRLSFTSVGLEVGLRVEFGR